MRPAFIRTAKSSQAEKPITLLTAARRALTKLESLHPKSVCLTPDNCPTVVTMKELRRAIEDFEAEIQIRYDAASHLVEGIEKENDALRTERDEIKAQIHDLCHDKHTQGPVTPEEFCLGCEQFQQSIFGESPITILRASRDALAAQATALRKAGIRFADWVYSQTPFYQRADNIQEFHIFQIALSLTPSDAVKRFEGMAEEAERLKAIVEEYRSTADITESDTDNWIDKCRVLTEELNALDADNARLKEALVKLRDCDWVITLPDRMDAVRHIASVALAGDLRAALTGEAKP